MPLFVAMELASLFAGGSGSGSTGLGTQSGTKKKTRIESVYSRGSSYKKPRKPKVAGRVVDSSAGSLPVALLHSGNEEYKVSWGSEVENNESSMSGVLNLENMANTIAEETSYIESGNNNKINEATSRKTRTRTYMLSKSPKAPMFDSMSDDENALSLPSPKMFNGSNQILSVKSRAMEKAKVMAISEKIMINNNLRRVNSHSDQEVIIKKISVNLLKSVVEAVFSKFGKIVSIKMQLIGLWQKALVKFESSEVANLVASKWSVFVGKDSMCVALAINDKQIDQHQALLYTLLVGTNAHDLSSLLESYGGKTCYIGRNPNSYVRNRCTVICFGNEASKLAAIGTVPVFKGVSLHWAGLSLASCTCCKQFSHVMINCSLGVNSGVRGKRVIFDQNRIRLTEIYKKKSAPIAHPVSFGGKTWAQVVGGSPSCVISSGLVGAGLHSGLVPFSMVTDFSTIFHLNDRLAILEHSLELLTDCVSGILVRLESIDLVPVATSSLSLLPAVFETLTSNVDSDMIMDTALVLSGTPPSVVHDAVVELSSSSSKVLTAKVSGLETKLIALEALKITTCNVRGINNPAKQKDVIHWHKDMNNLISTVTETKLKGVAIVVDNSLACHVCKVSEVSAGEVNFLIARAVNESSFVVLGGDFNEDGFRRCTSFKKCLDLGMVNSLAENSLAKSSTWRNSRGVVRIIDYVFISSNLVNAIVSQDVLDVCEYFDTNHQVVCVFVGLGGLLDMHLNSLHRQFNIRNANESKWDDFRSATLANAAMFSDEFVTSVKFSDLDVMWDIIREVMVFSADVFSKESSKFHKLELLVFKIIKASHKENVVGFASFMDCWASLDSIKALFVQDLMDSGHILSALSSTQKSYRVSKLIESQNAKEANIKSAIDRRMESFEVNKDHTIRSVLEHSFCKVVLDHLVVDSELVLEPDQVISKVDVIMEGWTRKRRVVNDMLSKWCCQYWPLEYVFDEAFSEVMCLIGFDEFFGVVSILPDGKAAGLSGISNELWKHCDRSVLKMLLVLLNTCLAGESESVLTNTHSIALIKTARKILSKVLSDRISAAYSTFNVLCEDNFLVLKGMTTQSPIFAVGSVIEDALKKNCELWLVLQNMKKTYDLVGWEHLEKSLVRIKMCMMTDFGLTGSYRVYDGLDQGEVFSLLLWCIFYDPLLCEVKCQESVCKYRLNLYFISKNGHAKTQTGLSSFFAASAFVNDTIWVNDISINNDKTVAILINNRVSSPSLSISGSPISVAKKGESHRYLGIFFSTEGLSKPSLAKAHSDICFFVNLVLRKAVSDKQFLYLVLAVLQSIISYQTQFSFILVGVCAKWDALVCKDLKLKSGLLLDFPSDTLHHLSFYSLKSFSQIQSECKVASLVSFVNSGGILGRLFSHKSHDLQVRYWHPIYLLNSPVQVNINASNNFLAGLVRILLDCNLSLGGSFVSSFRSSGSAPIFFLFSDGLALSLLINFVTIMQWKRVDPCGPVLEWFKLATVFLNNASLLSNDQFVSDGAVYQDILGSANYASVCDCLSQVISSSLSVYMDGSLRSLGTAGCKAGAAAFFEDINLGLGVGVSGLMLSTLVELHTIVLAMECVPLFCSVCVFSDSQSALSAYKSEMDLVCPDFRNQCWVECQHITNIICSKNLRVSWHKVKGHSGVSGNECDDEIAGIVSLSSWHLHSCLDEHFLVADSGVVSGNLRHFVQVGSGARFLKDDLLFDVDWFHSSMVWHPDSHMVTGSTSRLSANAHTYFMKALHHQLPVAVRKHLYNKYYPSVLCLYCGNVESSNHVFFCKVDDSARTLTGLLLSSLVVMQLLSSCASDFPVFVALYKGFVFNDWFCEAVFVFHNPKIAELEVVKFVHSLGLAFRDGVWMVCAKHCAYIEKAKLIPLDGSTPVSVFGLVLGFSAGVVKLLGITEAVSIRFGFRKPCFFSGVGSLVSVYISE
ncbi:hypothetical protein G9A89_012965 [Geosiphon pyriformis]|nr:hypothetical protein G9A89_012965 [Geosiphon pyriformis]